jgi:hypothetical protein
MLEVLSTELLLLISGLCCTSCTSINAVQTPLSGCAELHGTTKCLCHMLQHSVRTFACSTLPSHPLPMYLSPGTSACSS